MQDHKLVAFSEDGLKAIQERIETLRVDLGASGAILLDQTGELLVESGHHADLELNTFLTLLGNAMSAMNAVVHLLKDEGAFDLHFHEGQTYDMHTARIDDRIFLTLVFERHSGSSRVGMIWLSLRRTVTQLRSLLKQAMIESGSAESDKIKSAVSDAFDEAISRMDEDLFPTTPSVSPTSSISSLASTPEITPTPDIFSEPEIPPANQVLPTPKPRRRRTFDFSELRRREPLREEPLKEEPPAPPQISREVLDDPKHVLTYEEARALGLINLDDSNNK
ncbi:MAG: hypothetical protein HZB51_34655 [Chloroflexi bacterium]|nr:hypothetical protein [Chloroflexota bacterium]